MSYTMHPNYYFIFEEIYKKLPPEEQNLIKTTEDLRKNTLLDLHSSHELKNNKLKEISNLAFILGLDVKSKGETNKFID